jgi:hypothetical protein
MLSDLVTDNFVSLHCYLSARRLDGSATSLPCRDVVVRLFSCQTSPLSTRHTAWLSDLTLSGSPIKDLTMKGTLHSLSSPGIVQDIFVIKASFRVRKCAKSPTSKHVLQARDPSEAHSNDRHLLLFLRG